MAPAELRRFARKQLRELRDDVTKLELDLKNSAIHDAPHVCDAVRRLIQNRIEELSRFHQSDD